MFDERMKKEPIEDWVSSACPMCNRQHGWWEPKGRLQVECKGCGAIEQSPSFGDYLEMLSWAAVELEVQIKALKEGLEATAIAKHQVELGYGPSWSSNKDYCLVMSYLEGIEKSLQLQINEARGKR